MADEPTPGNSNLQKYIPESNNRNGVVAVESQGHEQEDQGHTEVEVRCGYGRSHPGCLQHCNNTKIALVVLSFYAIVQGFVVNGINNVNTTMYERRFGFSSLEVSMISSAYELAAGIFVIPIGYYGRIGHKPRWLAAACVIMGIGSCIMFLPHFTTGLYDAGSSTVRDLCSGDKNTTCTDTGLRGYLGVFILGQFLHGIGGTTLYTIGVVYLDDNVKTYQSPTYVGIMEGFAGLGPALGFIIGGYLLDIYVDADMVDTASLTLTTIDPSWVGAWWMGFMISAIMAITVGMLLFCFGWELPEAEKNRAWRDNQAHADGSDETTSREGFGYTLKDMPKATAILIKNPTFMCLTFAGVFAMLCAGGFATFMPKFIQNQFNQTASWAAYLTGFVAIPSAAGGQIIGGIVPTMKKWKVRGMIRMGAVSLGIGVLVLPFLFARCETVAYAGYTRQYGNSSAMREGAVNLTATCNAGCRCSTVIQEPICGQDGMEYFSACHAGCANYTLRSATTKNFTGCSCIAQSVLVENPSAVTSDVTLATTGRCDSATNCTPQQSLFLAFLFVVIFCIFLALTPTVTATLRCVPENLRGYSLAIQWVFIRFLGSIPGPLVFGAVVDSSCIVWQDKCGKRGSCWIYDGFTTSWRLLILSAMAIFFSFFFMLMASLVYKPPHEDKEKTAVPMEGKENKAFQDDEKDDRTKVKVVDGQGHHNPGFTTDL
ncbi:solute carrier organic anion transporter family member 4C1-like [Lineus longissimus]|uniref:solute carrier organic anion transporter family member 4C1-like n=1 Tax=Lineus longissimus TaxID=88925 RepID=UPI002B4D9F8F